MGLFGIGDGKIQIQVTSPDISSGATLTGTATITLNSDVKANGIIAKVYANRTTERYVNGNRQPETETFYVKEIPLDGDKLYPKSSSPLKYDFKFVIPQVTGNDTGNAPQQIPGALGSLINAAERMQPGGVVRWYVEVKMNVHMGIPMIGVQELNWVGARQPGAGMDTIEQ